MSDTHNIVCVEQQCRCMGSESHRLTDGFGVVLGSQEQFRGPVPERDHHWIEVGQRFEWCVEETSKAHVRYEGGEEGGRDGGREGEKTSTGNL